MNLRRIDQVRRFLATNLFTTIYGMDLGAWLRLLRHHHFDIDPPYWPRALFITQMSLLTSRFRRREARILPKVQDLAVQPPIIILGHWRSGTTYLHNLLAVDPQFAYPNLFQTLNPHTFLSSEKLFTLFRGFSPRTRIVDNVRFGFAEPQEDEFALCNATFLSPYMIWAFPRWEKYYDRYLTFQEVSPQELDEWKAALRLFLQKLTWKYERPVLLKSPPHTARIRLLLELFPEARFIHIHRDPYTVFQSTRHLFEFMVRATRLQRSNDRDLDTRILQRYNAMYDAFFAEYTLIPEGQFVEIRFEALEQDPLGQVEQIYAALGLSGFQAARPALQAYVAATANYRKNRYPALPTPLQRQIGQTWQRSFDVWGYAR